MTLAQLIPKDWRSHPKGTDSQGSGAHWGCGFHTSLTALTHSQVSKELPPALCGMSCCLQHRFNCTIPLHPPERLAWLGMIARTPATSPPPQHKQMSCKTSLNSPTSTSHGIAGHLLASSWPSLSSQSALPGPWAQFMVRSPWQPSPILPPFRTASPPTSSTQRTQTPIGSRQAAAFGSSF